MDEFLRSTLGSAYAYYIAFGILFVWWAVARKTK